jgi:hypothetical protein
MIFNLHKNNSFLCTISKYIGFIFLINVVEGERALGQHLQRALFPPLRAMLRNND